MSCRPWNRVKRCLFINILRPTDYACQSIYINELLLRLTHFGYDCMIGRFYYGAIGYADDVTLVARSVYYMNKMCKISLEFVK